MKLFINNSRENWICDRLRDEFYKLNPDICTEDINQAEIVWIMAPWAFNKPRALVGKKVIVTVHHLVPDKFNKRRVFRLDSYVDFYHTPSQKSKSQIKEFTNKDIIALPWWINDKIWNPLDKESCRKELNLSKDEFIIGSFQRDTEGSDLKTPKLEKGPDRFCDIIEDIYKKNKKIRVLLGGWRRHYILSRMSKAGIPCTYIERPSFEVVNKMYNSLDLYIVASRHEGGPQSVPECCATKTPIISTDVGCASFFLNNNCIFDFPNYKESLGQAKESVEENYKNCLKKITPNGFNEFLKFLK